MTVWLIIFIILFLITLFLLAMEHLRLLSVLWFYTEKNAPEFSREEILECVEKVLRHIFKKD